jgi:hypothetical protein
VLWAKSIRFIIDFAQNVCCYQRIIVPLQRNILKNQRSHTPNDITTELQDALRQYIKSTNFNRDGISGMRKIEVITLFKKITDPLFASLTGKKKNN